MGRALLVLMCVLVSACSFVFVKEPNESKAATPEQALACTTSRAMPFTDLALGAVLGGLAAATTYAAIESVNDEDCRDCFRGTKPAILAAFLVVSPWWISSAVGFSDTGRCRRVYESRGMAPP
jgi:hypothetical protein